MEPRCYREQDYDGHGLRCMDCRVVFVEGQPIASRLTGIDTNGALAGPCDEEGPDDPLYYTETICVGCSLEGVR